MLNAEVGEQGKNDFEKDLFMLMSHSVFGKTMENLRNRTGNKIVQPKGKKIHKLIGSSLYSRHMLFSGNLTGIQMHKTKLVLNKLVYVGVTNLNKRKILMYDFHYNLFKKRCGKKCELRYATLTPTVFCKM